MELTYKDRKIRTTSYELRYGLWMPQAEVMTDGTVQSLPGERPVPSQAEADQAAVEVAKAYIDQV